jgi:hypothetical protein
MSMLAENKHEVNGSTMLAITSLVKHVLVNQTQAAWDCLLPAAATVNGYPAAAGGPVDIVTDNAGYELFTDMCLADFLIATDKATMVENRY